MSAQIMSFLSLDGYTFHHAVMQKMFSRPATPFITLCQPPYCQTPSEVSHHLFQPMTADSKSETQAIRMLMATMMNGKGLNQCLAPMPHLYLIIMKPMHPAVAAYSLA